MLARILSASFMLIGTVLLLNLLVALMADSYAEVAKNGLAQWRFEQALLVVDNELGMSPDQRANTSWLYTRQALMSVIGTSDAAENSREFESELEALRCQLAVSEGKADLMLAEMAEMRGLIKGIAKRGSVP